jgi:hypothetical protein
LIRKIQIEQDCGMITRLRLFNPGKSPMRLNRLPLLVFLAAAFFLLAAGEPPPQPATPELEAQLAAAFADRLQAFQSNKPLVLDIYTPEVDAAFISPDGKIAVLWLALRDDSGRVLGTEPGLALAQLETDGWHVLLQGDPGWDKALAALPEGMLPAEQSPVPAGVQVPAAPTPPLYGYYLPYAAGTAHWLEGSISHYQKIPELGYPSCAVDAYCLYAYDFTDTGHYPLRASKGGTVYGSRDSCPDGGETCTNYITLYNADDEAYQIYLHIAYGTIPDNLTKDTFVARGQYLGDTDDTGYSTSEHVHFMVVQNRWTGSGNYDWGVSVDIRFADVAINNGIPRNCYELIHFGVVNGATQCTGSMANPDNRALDLYVSGNVGDLTRPAAGATVAVGANPLIDVTAYPVDDVQVTAVQLMAMINGQWVEIGPRVTQPVSGNKYDWDVNLCEAGPLNGPLEVAMRIYDNQGNLTAPLLPRTIQVDHACPPPVSQLLPAQSFASTAVQLSWTAGEAGAGLSAFELQWRLIGGAWDAANTLTFPASQRSTWFSGNPGSSYGFRLRAVDTNGQPEAWPAGDLSEIEVTLPSACSPDAFEPDDTPAQARGLTLGAAAQGSLCVQANPDWFLLTLNPAATYTVRAASLNGGAAVRLTVYRPDGQTVLATGQAAGVGMDARTAIRSAGESQVYIRVEPLTPNLFGTDAVYSLIASEAREIFLPILLR